MADGQPVPGSLYVYAPNQWAPIVFTVAFALSAAVHIWQCYAYRCSRMTGVHTFCAVVLTLGYALREYGAYNYIYSTNNLIVFILSQVFINVCPPLLELANYHILARILGYIPHCSPVSPARVMPFFSGLIAIIELVNALGIALAANPSSSPTQQKTGSHLIKAAIATQLCVISACVVLAAMFHRRCARARVQTKAIWAPVIVLYVSMGLLFVRCVYRLVEHTGNTTVRLRDPEGLKRLTPLLRYEWFFWVFEGALILINSLVWNVWNPGRFLPRNRWTHLAKDGITVVEGDGPPDTRAWWQKVGGVVTFGMAFKAPEKGRYQEMHEEHSLVERAV